MQAFLDEDDFQTEKQIAEQFDVHYSNVPRHLKTKEGIKGFEMDAT